MGLKIDTLILKTAIKKASSIVPKSSGANITLGLKPSQLTELDTFIPTTLKKAKTILNTTTGKTESISFSTLPDKIEDFRTVHHIVAFDEIGNKIGGASFQKIRPRCGEDFIKIDYIGTQSGYKGIGSEIIRELSLLSKRSGISKIYLTACTGEVPPAFRFSGYGDKIRTSAAIKYYKMGFRSKKERINNLIEEEIAKGGNGFRPRTTPFGTANADMFSGIEMYLSL